MTRSPDGGPKSEHDRVRFNSWSALIDATSVKDGKLRLRVLISELEHRGYESAARCLAEDLDALMHLRYPLRHRERWRSTNLLGRGRAERMTGTVSLTVAWATIVAVELSSASRLSLDAVTVAVSLSVVGMVWRELIG